MMERLLSLYIAAQARNDEEGQTVIEYALILAFVAAVAVVLGAGAGGTLRAGVDEAFDAIAALF